MRTFSLVLLVSLALIAIAETGCRNDRPEQPPPSGKPMSPAQGPPSQPEPGSQPASTAGADTATHADTITVAHPEASATPGVSRPGWKRAELVQGVQDFVTAIDSNQEDRFWSSLSQRSTRWIDRDKPASRAEIWNAARQTLGDIRNRHITVIGGSRDSVALQIDGLRLVGNVREDDPVIIHLLREKGNWRVMYPGLLYPRHYLQR